MLTVDNGFLATCQQPTLFLDTHVADKNAPMILCEVPEVMFKARDNNMTVYIELGAEAMKQLDAARPLANRRSAIADSLGAWSQVATKTFRGPRLRLWAML